MLKFLILFFQDQVSVVSNYKKCLQMLFAIWFFIWIDFVSCLCEVLFPTNKNSSYEIYLNSNKLAVSFELEVVLVELYLHWLFIKQNCLKFWNWCEKQWFTVNLSNGYKKFCDRHLSTANKNLPTTNANILKIYCDRFISKNWRSFKKMMYVCVCMFACVYRCILYITYTHI